MKRISKSVSSCPKDSAIVVTDPPKVNRMSQSLFTVPAELINESVEIIKAIGDTPSDDIPYEQLLKAAAAYNVLRWSKSTSEDSNLLAINSQQVNAIATSYGATDDVKDAYRWTLARHIGQGRELINLSDFDKPPETEQQ